MPLDHSWPRPGRRSTCAPGGPCWSGLRYRARVLVVLPRRTGSRTRMWPPGWRSPGHARLGGRCTRARRRRSSGSGIGTTAGWSECGSRGAGRAGLGSTLDVVMRTLQERLPPPPPEQVEEIRTYLLAVLAAVDCTGCREQAPGTLVMNPVAVRSRSAAAGSCRQVERWGTAGVGRAGGRRRRRGVGHGVAGAGHLLGLVDRPVDLSIVPGKPPLRELAPLLECLVDLLVVLVEQFLCLVEETHAAHCGRARRRFQGRRR